MKRRLPLIAGVLALSLALAAPARAVIPFTDVPTNSWAYGAINELWADGIIKGYPDETFRGNRQSRPSNATSPPTRHRASGRQPTGAGRRRRSAH
ncbi:MAG: S-layer homology domain-containing protein [Vulcanimicrobiaceae bacterium]